MSHPRARILVADHPQGALSLALDPVLVHHEVDFALDTADTIYRIDCAGHPYDLLFCDLTRRGLSGPELWAYLSLSRQSTASRMVFVASRPPNREAQAFLARVPNVCVELPFDAEALHMFAVRRATCGTSYQQPAPSRTRLPESFVVTVPCDDETHA